MECFSPIFECRLPPFIGHLLSRIRGSGMLCPRSSHLSRDRGNVVFILRSGFPDINLPHPLCYPMKVRLDFFFPVSNLSIAQFEMCTLIVRRIWRIIGWRSVIRMIGMIWTIGMAVMAGMIWMILISIGRAIRRMLAGSILVMVSSVILVVILVVILMVISGMARVTVGRRGSGLEWRSSVFCMH